MGMDVADATGHLPGQFADTLLFAGDLQAPVLVANVGTPVAASLLLLYIRSRTLIVLSLTYCKVGVTVNILTKFARYSGSITHIDPYLHTDVEEGAW